MSVIILTTGVPGCGKTYVRAARFLVDDFLINSHGVHISNFPLNREEIAREVSARMKRRSFWYKLRHKVSEEDLIKRMQIIPDDVLQSWKREESGPWDYFSGVNLKYAHIALDEVHNFVSEHSSEDYIKRWDEFLGEVRHRGCTFEALTQDIHQVPKELQGRAAIRLELVNAEDFRDPFFGIRMGDWYELKAAFTGDFHKTVFEVEYRRSLGRWKKNHSRRFLLVPEYFKFYNSFNASLSEKADGVTDEGRAVEYEYQRRSKFGLLLWFLGRNFLTLFLRIVIAVLVIWLCFFGGLTTLINGFIDGMLVAGKSNSGSSKSVSAAKSVSPQNKLDQSVITKHQGSASGQMSGQGSDETVPVLVDPDYDKFLFKPAMFFDNCCWLRNGLKIKVGYKFKVGIYEDREVKEINAADRYFVLDDGVECHMY